jgi:wyosine [tRNA(Phe)-imidazoG37] synthetase (radical SAM superfamily)
MKHIYGPVTSRRLGSSLGVDVLPLKTCSFNCIYCQLGATLSPTVERAPYIAAAEVLSEIEEYLAGDGPRPDYITFSGSGEPTLHSELGEMIQKAKNMAEVKIAVLTNSSMITLPEVRSGISAADLVVPSLDAATQAVFERVNRPAPGLKIDSIINGLEAFRKEFAGELRLEVLLVEGINDSQSELEKMRDAARRILPDAIDLNTVARPPADSSASALTSERMAEVAEFFGEKARAVLPSKKMHHGVPGEAAKKILSLLRRRPCSFAEICSSLGLGTDEAAAALAAMSRKGLVTSVDGREDGFYRAR